MVRLGSLLVTAAVLLSGCIYSFTGGGLPRHIRTIAVVPFENTTPEAGLTTEIYTQLQEQLPRSLGVRLTDERVADAVIRGRITGFDEPPPVVRPPAPGGRVEPVQGQIRLTVEAEIYDLRENRALWQNRSLSVIGNYQFDREQRLAGQTRAVQELARRIIEGAQSQW
jgi:hypothetical protein